MGGGSRMNPENYRPVSLTSHIMKVFERVVKVNLIEHLGKHGLINKGQHGFVEGRSTQTQLLEHFCRVYEALEEGARMGTVYLDFAKAFDKVDHNILMEKIASGSKWRDVGGTRGKIWCASGHSTCCNTVLDNDRGYRRKDNKLHCKLLC